MAHRVLIPPILISHKLGRLTSSGNGLLLDDMPYEALVDCHQPENIPLGDRGPTRKKLEVQCKFRGLSHIGEMSLLLSRLKGRDNEMTEEFLGLTTMMSREFHHRNQSTEQTKLDKQAEIDLKELFFKAIGPAGQEDRIEECYEQTTHLQALHRAAEALGLFFQSTQGPAGFKEDKHHIVIGHRREKVSQRIQEMNRYLYQDQPITQSRTLPSLENRISAPPSPTNIVAIRDPNPPYVVAGKWFMQNPNQPNSTYPMTIWNQEVGSNRRQIFGLLEIDQGIYIRFVDPSVADASANNLAVFSMNTASSPSSAQPSWNLLWRSSMGIGMGSVRFGGEFGFEAEMVLRMAGQGGQEVGFNGFKSGDGDGTEVNIEVEWAALGGDGQRLLAS